MVQEVFWNNIATAALTEQNQENPAQILKACYDSESVGKKKIKKYRSLWNLVHILPVTMWMIYNKNCCYF